MSNITATLFANLSDVVVDEVLTHSSALLLTKDSRLTKYELRGFITSASLETFTMSVPSAQYRLEPFRPNARGEYQCAQLHVEGTHARILLRGNYHAKKIVEFQYENVDYQALFGILEREVAAHWDAPAMPVCRHVDADQVRQMLGVRRAWKDEETTWNDK